jgi:hypothetical protein
MAERGQVGAGEEQLKPSKSPYKRGHHPNSRRNLRPFQAGGDPRATTACKTRLVRVASKISTAGV